MFSFLLRITLSILRNTTTCRASTVMCARNSFSTLIASVSTCRVRVQLLARLKLSLLLTVRATVVMADIDMEMLGLGVKREAEGAANTATPGKMPKTAGKGGKAAKGGGRADKGEKEIIKQLAKLSLLNARQVAALSSAVICTVVFKKNEIGEGLVKRLKDVTMAYSLQVKEMKPELKASFSAPHIFVWSALLTYAKEHFKDNAELLQAVDKHNTEVTEAVKRSGYKVEQQDELKAYRRKLIGLQVKICRVARCWATDLAKLELTTDNQSTAHQVQVHLVKSFEKHMQGSVKQGMAPRGDVERRIQRYIDGTTEE
eukprot:TRINITY_DN65042_c0_g1_i1.p2 TRINITY_DN65042_c0_g1~~TRINITY_DN65042_c0_g1_i1.p2  ORF type:complete len:315 (+),score=81.34 TRINITY_DN65042_c0_g1_i1:71-1015(+)